MVVMGQVTAPFGVQGWVKIHSYTETPASLLEFPTWWLGREGSWRETRVDEARLQGKALVARLAGCANRDAVESLRGLQIALPRDWLDEPGEDEFYWVDLIGLEVVNRAGETLGTVAGLLETGANDVLQVQGDRQRLIPFIAPVVLHVDRAAGRISVDWDADY